MLYQEFLLEFVFFVCQTHPKKYLLTTELKFKILFQNIDSTFIRYTYR